MSLPNRQFFNYLLLLIGVVAVATNLVLLWTAWRFRYYTKEIQLAALLASVDIILAILIISTSFLGTRNGRLENFCKFKGPIDFIMLYLSLVLVAVIAMTRYCKVSESNIPMPIWILISICIAMYSILVSIAAANGEFVASWSGCDCTPDATNSLTSAALLFSLGFSMFVSLIATLFSYLRVLCFVKDAHIKLKGSPNAKHRAMVRVATVSFVYLLLIAPSSIFIMLEGSRNSNESDLLNAIISILNALNNIANPSLVLFAHSLIFDQLRLSFRSAKTIRGIVSGTNPTWI